MDVRCHSGDLAARVDLCLLGTARANLHRVMGCRDVPWEVTLSRAMVQFELPPDQLLIEPVSSNNRSKTESQWASLDH